jgi:hypothetical protein
MVEGMSLTAVRICTKGAGKTMKSMVGLGHDFLPPQGEALSGGKMSGSGLARVADRWGKNNYFAATNDTAFCRCRVRLCSPAGKANLTFEKGGLLKTG